MGSLLKLYTYINELNFTIVEHEDEDTPSIEKAEHILRDGEMVAIHIIVNEEMDNPIYILSGGHFYEDYQCIEELERAFLSLQQKPSRLYEITEHF